MASVLAENATSTLLPFLNRSVDSLLDVSSVEIDGGTFGQVVEASGETENVPEQRAGSSDLIDVETRVDKADSVEDVVPEFTTRHAVVGVGWSRKETLRWESESLFHKGSVAAFVGAVADVVREGLVQVEQSTPMVDIRSCWDVLQHHIVGDGRVEDLDAMDIVESRIVLLDEVFGNVFGRKLAVFLFSV